MRTIEILRQLIMILAATIHNTSLKQPDGFQEADWEALYQLADRHGVVNLVAYGIRTMPDVPKSILQKFLLRQSQEIAKEANQEIMLQTVVNALEQAGLSAMPLKGCILKHLYPSPDMREMCDIDMLIRVEEYPKVRQIMEALGFTFQMESPHEYIFIKKPYLNFELHKSLVPDYNKKLYEFYGDGWKQAKTKSGMQFVYEMSHEDFYLYNIVHSAKHYINGGIGIRQVLDVWVMNRGLQELDRRYVMKQLKFLGLLEFEQHLTELSKAWFDGEVCEDLITEEMGRFILGSAAQGTENNFRIANIYRNSGNAGYRKGFVHYFLTLLFPKRKKLALRYPVLERYPILYPFCAVHRMFVVTFFKRSLIREKFDIQDIASEDISRFAAHCKALRLDADL